MRKLPTQMKFNEVLSKFKELTWEKAYNHDAELSSDEYREMGERIDACEQLLKTKYENNYEAGYQQAMIEMEQSTRNLIKNEEKPKEIEHDVFFAYDCILEVIREKNGGFLRNLPQK